MLEIGKIYFIDGVCMRLVNMELHASPYAAPDNRFEFEQVQIENTDELPRFRDLTDRINRYNPVDVPIFAFEFNHGFTQNSNEQKDTSETEDDTDWLNILNN